MFVIGTAGHVDHGKSALVRALTGIDPDRLPEEKHRGMTIDLGFASLRLPGGADVSIVDVPGHERFIKNMLAGVGGIDLALLVVAAEEGVMPQTREHLDILNLLGIERGVVALTKCDLVDADWLDLVAAEVEELLAGTTLQGAPIVPCSAVTGEGLPRLVETLEALLARAATRRETGRPRLPIDRVFTVAGFGTVVTGTLIDGPLSVGDEIEIVPAVAGGKLSAIRARVRNLQNHGTPVDRALPGTRTAVNVAGVEPAQLSRGQVLTVPGWLVPSTAVDVRLQALPSLPRPLRHNLAVTFHSFSAETAARLRLLEGDEIQPGGEAWTQIRLTDPMAVVRGDRFVIRDANGTIGGGVVVATQAPRHPRDQPGLLARFELQARGDPADALYAAIAAMEPASVGDAASRAGLSASGAAAALEALLRDGRAVAVGEGHDRVAWTAEGFARLSQGARAIVDAFLAQAPLRFGIGREELRSRLKLAPRVFDRLVAAWAASGVIVESGPLLAPQGWAPRLTPAERDSVDRYLAALKANPFAPVVESQPVPELVAYLAERGDVVDVGAGVVFAAGAYRDAVARVVALVEARKEVTMAEVRDDLGSSRRYVQALLEHMDRERITFRRGDVRILRGG